MTEDDYFYQAVLWAVEQGITNGTQDESYFGAQDGLFSPDKDCNRAEVLTFLWRARGPDIPLARQWKTRSERSKFDRIRLCGYGIL